MFLDIFAVCSNYGRCGSKSAHAAYTIIVSEKHNNLNNAYEHQLTSSELCLKTEEEFFKIILPDTLSDSTRKLYKPHLKRAGNGDWVEMEVESQVEQDFVRYVKIENKRLSTVETIHRKFIGTDTCMGFQDATKRYVDFNTFLDFINSLNRRFPPK